MSKQPEDPSWIDKFVQAARGRVKTDRNAYAEEELAKELERRGMPKAEASQAAAIHLQIG
jgi:hypothetical protein